MAFIEALDNSVNSARSVLIVDVFTGDMYTLANYIRTGIRSIAVTILSLCFVIEFLKVIVRAEILKWETGVKVAAKLVLGYVALDISAQIMEAIYATGANLINRVSATNISMGDLVQDKLRAALENLGIIQAIGMLATLGVAFFIIWLTGIVIMVIAYARSIELLLHIAIAPIPCAFLLLEDHQGSRLFWKFLMSFAANCLQGFFIVLSIALYDVLVTEIFDAAKSINAELPAIAGSLLMGAIVLVTCVVKSGSIAKQILDV